MSSANPITRSTRRRDLDATAGQTVFTLDVPVYDLADVEVFRKTASDLFWIPVTSGVTLSFVNVNQVQATFAVAPRPTAGDPVTTVRLQSARVQERITNATRGGAVASALLEADLDRIATVLQELRRDIDEANAAKPAIAGNVFSAASDPLLRPDGTALQAGDLYFNTATQTMRIYNGTAWTNLATAANSSFRTYAETSATAKATFTITGGYTVGLILVFLNGVLLEPSEFTASNGTTVVLAASCAVSDEFRAVIFTDFAVANVVQKSGDSMSGQLAAVGLETLPDGSGNSNLFIDGPGSILRWLIGRDGASGRLSFNRYDATGAFQSSPILIDPANGNVGVNMAPSRQLDVTGDIGSTTLVTAPAIVGSNFNGGPLAGFRNRIINPRFEVAQRGASGVIGLSGSFSTDRWLCIATGATATWAQLTGATGLGEFFGTYLQMTGAASNTLARILHRIEGSNSADLCGKTVTLSAYVLQVSGGPRNVFMGVSRANALNNFAGTTSLASNAPGTAVPDNTWTRVSFTFNLPASGPELGLVVTFDLNVGLLAGQTMAIANVQLEVGDRATAMESRPISVEQDLCRRYYRQQQFWVPAATAQNLGVIDMRATPTITGGGTGFTSTGTTANQLIAFQTTGALQTLNLDAEI